MSNYPEEVIPIDEAIAIENAVRERAEQYEPGHQRTKGYTRGLIPWHSDIVYTNGVEECSDSP